MSDFEIEMPDVDLDAEIANVINFFMALPDDAFKTFSDAISKIDPAVAVSLATVVNHLKEQT